MFDILFFSLENHRRYIYFNFNMSQTLPEYYSPYIDLVQSKDPESTKTQDVREGKQEIPDQYKT